MTLSFLAGDPLEIAHVRGRYRRAYHCKMIDLSCFTAALIVLNEYLEIENVLEFNVSQRHWISLLDIFRR